MRIPSNVTRSDLGVNLTPMIDVVFQLIIFFLLSSHLAKQESRMPLPLPYARTGVDPSSHDVPRLTLNIQSNGEILMGGKPVSPLDLPQRFRDKQSLSEEDIEIYIRSDRSAPYRDVEPILSACSKNGIGRVTFAVQQHRDSE